MFYDADSAERSDQKFAEQLSRLKQHGTSVLIVGSVRDTHRESITRLLIGDDAGEIRHRVLVSTNGSTGDCFHYLNNRSSGLTELITYGAHSRSVSTTSTPIEPVVDESERVAEDLSDLGIEISSAIERIEMDTEELNPADLRVCIDSLVPLLDQYGEERVFTFIHLINGRAITAGGMCQYHLPVERTANVVSVLRPLFDIVIELRENQGICQHRWTLVDSEHESGWLPLTAIDLGE